MSHDDTITAGFDGSGNGRVPDRIGKYTIVGKLGEGGMGIVYEAEQDEPRRRVALKIVRGGPLVDDVQVRLLRREAETLARLKHPSIASIYESGRTADGRHYFVMELVRGHTLDRYLAGRDGPVSPAELEHRLQLFRRICDAVHYAHQRGVIHRDLKPSNIVVTEEGAANSDAGSHPSRPRLPLVKILDFGLARITDGDLQAATLATEIGMIKGTLPYMAPEQARGRPEEIDTRTDVYALGVILYEMLAGRRPYDTDRAALAEALRVICEAPPRALRSSWRGTRALDADVETIVQKALEKEPQRRYGSAAALSEDVDRYLRSQPILAVPPSALYQLRKFAARNKVLVAAAVAVVATLILGLVGTTGMFLRAQSAEREAVALAADARRGSYLANLRAAELLFDDGNVDQARAHLDAAPEELRGWEWGYLARMSRPALLKSSLEIPYMQRAQVAFDPAGGKLVVGVIPIAGRPVIADVDIRTGAAQSTTIDDEPAGDAGQAWHIDLASRRLLRQAADGIELHPIGRASASPLVLSRGLAPSASEEEGSRVEHAVVSTDGKLAALAIRTTSDRQSSAPRRIDVYELPRGTRLASHQLVSEGTVRSIAISDEPRQVAVNVVRGRRGQAGAGTIEITAAENRTLLMPTEADGELGEVLTFLDGGRKLVASQSKSVTVWNLESEQVAMRYPTGENEAAWSVAATQNGTRLALGMSSGLVIVLDIAEGRAELTDRRGGALWSAGPPQPTPVATHRDPASGVVAVAFSSDDSRLAAVDMGSTVYLWRNAELAEGRRFELPIQTEAGYLEGGLRVHSPEEKRLVLSFDDGTIVPIDLVAGRPASSTPGEPVVVRRVTSRPEQRGAWRPAADPGGALIAVPGDRLEIRLTSASTGELVDMLRADAIVAGESAERDLRIEAVALSRRGERVAVMTSDGDVVLLDRSGAAAPPLPRSAALEHGAASQQAAMSKLVGAKLAHVASGLRFAREGSRVIAARGAGLTVWDLERHVEIPLEPIEADTLSAIAVSDTRSLVAAVAVGTLSGGSGTLAIWDMDDGTLLHSLDMQVAQDGVRLAFTPDGGRLFVERSQMFNVFVAGGKSTIEIYDTDGLTRLLTFESNRGLQMAGIAANGTDLILASAVASPDRPFAVEIWTASADGGSADPVAGAIDR